VPIWRHGDSAGSLIYGASAIWGLSGAGARGDAATVRILERFYGACAHSILRADSDPAVFLDAFYLNMVPFFALRGRNLEDFERDGELTRIHLEGGAIIESNLAKKTLRISLKGVDVLKDDAVFCPMGELADGPAKIACYSITPQRVAVSVPAGWNAAEMIAVALYPERREKVAIEQQGDSVSIALGARQPVMLYRNKSEARLG
jgi:hypothetical protein